MDEPDRPEYYSLIFFSTQKGHMQATSEQKRYHVYVLAEGGTRRMVVVKASNPTTAKERALKRTNTYAIHSCIEVKD